MSKGPVTANAPGSLSWGVLLANVFGMGVLGLMAGLLLWTVLPLAFGWNTSMVMSGSMAPALLTGDAIVIQPVPAERLRPGFVVVADDPDQADRLRAHRIESVGEDGMLVLRGDANTQADSSPVAPEAVHGMARLRVPYIALPMVWARTGHETYAAAAALLAVLAVLGASAGPVAKPVTRRGRRRAVPRRRVPAGATGSLVAGLAVTTLIVATWAGNGVHAQFTSATGTGASFGAASRFCTTTTVTLTADADDSVDQSSPGTYWYPPNAGSTQLRVESKSGANRRSLVRFPLSEVPAYCSITAASMKMTIPGGSVDNPNFNILATEADRSWTEGQVTWNHGVTTRSGSATTSVAKKSTGTATFNVLSQVNSMRTKGNHGFLLKHESEGQGTLSWQGYYSREATTASDRPTLTITYG